MSFLGLDNLIYVIAVAIGFFLFGGSPSKLFIGSLVLLSVLSPVMKFTPLKPFGLFLIQFSAGFADLLSLSLIFKKKNITYIGFILGSMLLGISLGIPIRSVLGWQDFLFTYGSIIFTLLLLVFFYFNNLREKERTFNSLESKLSKLGIPKELLSKREMEVLQGLLDNKKQEEIAEELGISPSTVKTYASRIYRKLGVSSKKELLKLLNG